MSPLQSVSGGAGHRLDADGAATHLIVAAPLTAGGHPNSNMPGRRKEDDVNLIAFSIVPEGGQGADLRACEVDTAPALTNIAENRSTDRGLRIASAAGVRRLTPVECERLQGFPDGWTDLGGTPDSRRYAAIGDAVTVPVARWIAERLIRFGGVDAPLSGA